MGSALRITQRPLNAQAGRVDFVWILNVLEKNENPVESLLLEAQTEGMAFSKLSFEIRAKERQDVFTLCGENACYKNSLGEEYYY